MRLAWLSMLCSSNVFSLISIFYGKILSLSGGGFGKAFWYFGSWDGTLVLGGIDCLVGKSVFCLGARKSRIRPHVHCTVAMQVWGRDSISTQQCGKAVHSQGLMPEINQ